MKTIEDELNGIKGHLVSIKRNPLAGRYELEIGIPLDWVYSNTVKIECQLLQETANGKLLKIISKDDEVIVDDMIQFVATIIETNGKIAEKELEFNTRMNEMKALLEDEAKKFYEELDNLKESSFKAISNNNTSQPDEIKKSKKNKSSVVDPASVTNVE